MITHYNDSDEAAKRIIARVGKQVVISVPLGIGKPIGLLNALYRLAVADLSIHLTILTALTLARPVLNNELEKRFIEPILDRLLKDYEDPLYEVARVKQQLPSNINVIEFFLTPGNYLDNAYVQQNYNSATYTNAVRDGFQLPINVHAQQVAKHEKIPDSYSLSCNSDLFHDITLQLQHLAKQGRSIAIVAEVNEHLPFMLGEAQVEENVFSDVIDTGHYHSLFAIPRSELSVQDHVIGLYTSALVKDDGCLQIGIGKLSNAVASALIMRHRNNDIYLELLKQLNVTEKCGEIVSAIGATTPFDIGLYASTEMLSDEYMQLYQAGVLKKKVYDHAGLQALLNSHAISEMITPEMVDSLVSNGIINTHLSLEDVTFLQKFGIFKSSIAYESNMLVLPTGEKIPADLASLETKNIIMYNCLGSQLLTGKIMHAGFFVGSDWLYTALHQLTDDELNLIDMSTISRTNQLTWAPELLHLQRQHARFINSSIMLTLAGMAISDGLKDYQEFSGVGGQFDFVSMASQLKHARSIINCRSTRNTKNGVVSNIVWDYPNFSIPRFFRDIVITEYGVADCRGKTDSEVIKAMLNVTDSRFQRELLAKAKAAGKLQHDYNIPDLYLNNYPEVIQRIISKVQSQGYCLPYPFGSDMTDDEQVLARALKKLKNSSGVKLIILMCASLFHFDKDADFDVYLIRMRLKYPKSVKEWMYKKMLKYVMGKKRV